MTPDFVIASEAKQSSGRPTEFATLPNHLALLGKTPQSPTFIIKLTGNLALFPERMRGPLALPDAEASSPFGSTQATLIMLAAEGPGGPNIAAAMRQIEQALFVGYRVDMSDAASPSVNTSRSNSRVGCIDAGSEEIS